MEFHNNNQPLVSVVTPVYNGADYIAECIESVIAQNYSNWEYHIVDNCSDDGTYEIANEYENNDHRIHVHRCEDFYNQIPNWNRALTYISAESEYCKVIQADDWIYPECLQKMVSLAEEYPSVGVVSAYRLVEENVRGADLPYRTNFLEGINVCRKILYENSDLFGSATTVLFKSSVVRSDENFFNESVIHADTYACFKVLRNHDFGFVHQVLTFTRRHNQATTTFCNYYHTYILNELVVLRDFGVNFFSPEEESEILNKSLFKHHRELIDHLLKYNNKDIWDYHRDELQKMGLAIDWKLFTKALLLELVDFKSILKLLRQKMFRNSISESHKNDQEVIKEKKISTVSSSDASAT